MGKDKICLGGFVGHRMIKNLDNWLIQVPYNNPGMFEMFRRRDVKPHQLLVPWYGEFPGKYLTSAVLCYRLGRDQRLLDAIRYAVERLLSVQGEDGYLGVFPQGQRLIGAHDPSRPWDRHWDLWGHYHCMLGLLMWYEEDGDGRALSACVRAADYVRTFFARPGVKIEDAGWAETNMSILHVYTLLYEQTGEKRFLDFAMEILKAIATPQGGDYLNAALAGMEYFQMRKPRWEGLHSVMALGEIGKITGEMKYVQAVRWIWQSIQRYDRHNTGGFSSGEQAQGCPYDMRPIETCCTVAWIALGIDLWKLTGEPLIIDEIELSTLNGILGAQSPNGRYFTYNSPMIGVKQSSQSEIAFQSHAGSPELNCCSLNGPRGLGMIAQWSAVLGEREFVVNYYGEMDATYYAPDGGWARLRQSTSYPLEGRIDLTLEMDRARKLLLKLRIPLWSRHSQIWVNTEKAQSPEPGTYYEIPLRGARLTVRLVLDMALHYWPGDKAVKGKISLYHGPILLAYDQRFNDQDYHHPPAVRLRGEGKMTVCREFPVPWILLAFDGDDGRQVLLCDYASAGATGMGFTTWLATDVQCPPARLDGDKPTWAHFPEDDLAEDRI